MLAKVIWNWSSRLDGAVMVANATLREVTGGVQ
jgi:hypothetical protein